MLTSAEIDSLLNRLNEVLERSATRGELYLVGGAVMCLAHKARPSTADVDGYFVPVRAVREAARIVADETGVSPSWLNDAVKGFLSSQGEFSPYLELSSLRVMVAVPEYLLAMKCMALRLGAEFHDLDDVRYLLRALNIESVEQAIAVITRYYPEDTFPPKSRFALQELLGPPSAQPSQE